MAGIAETDPNTFAVAGPPDTEAADSLAWQYQYCTEFGMLSSSPNMGLWPGLIACVCVGFFQGANPHNNRSIQSQFSSQENIQKDCLNAFPKGAVPPEPSVGGLNNVYGGWYMNPTHVFFTDGQIDPWRTLSVGSFEDNAPKRVGAVAIPA